MGLSALPSGEGRYLQEEREQLESRIKFEAEARLICKGQTFVVAIVAKEKGCG